MIIWDVPRNLGSMVGISAKSRLNGNPIFEWVLSNLVVDNVRIFLNYRANSLQNSTSGTVFLSFWGGWNPDQKERKFRVSGRNQERSTFPLGSYPKPKHHNSTRRFLSWFQDFGLPSHPPATKHKTCNLYPHPCPLARVPQQHLGLSGLVLVLFPIDLRVNKSLFGKQRIPTFGGCINFMDTFWCGEKGQSWHNAPKGQNEERCRHHRFMIMEILHTLHSHVQYKFQIQCSNSSCIHHVYLRTKTQVTTTHIHVLINFPWAALWIFFLNMSQCCSPSDFGSETIPLWPFDWPLFSCPAEWGWWKEGIIFDLSSSSQVGNAVTFQTKMVQMLTSDKTNNLPTQCPYIEHLLDDLVSTCPTIAWGVPIL